MKFPQLLYGVGGKGSADAGYQTLAASPGISKKERYAIEDISTVGDPLPKDESFPFAWAFSNLEEGDRYGLVRIVKGGVDQRGRPGIVFAHSMVMNRQNLARTDFNALRIGRAAQAKLANEPQYPSSLSEMEIDVAESRQPPPVDPLLRAFPGDSLPTLFSALFTETRIGLTSPTYDAENVSAVIEALLGCIPGRLRLQCPFSTYSLRPGTSPFRCVYFPDRKRVRDRTQDLAVFELGVGARKTEGEPTRFGHYFAAQVRKGKVAFVVKFARKVEGLGFEGTIRDLERVFQFQEAEFGANNRGTSEDLLLAAECLLEVPAHEEGRRRNGASAAKFILMACRAFPSKRGNLSTGKFVDRALRIAKTAGGEKEVETALGSLLLEFAGGGDATALLELFKALPKVLRVKAGATLMREKANPLFDRLRVERDPASPLFRVLLDLFEDQEEGMETLRRFHLANDLFSVARESEGKRTANRLLDSLRAAHEDLESDPERLRVLLGAERVMGQRAAALDRAGATIHTLVETGDEKALAALFEDPAWEEEEGVALVKKLHALVERLETGAQRTGLEQIMNRAMEKWPKAKSAVAGVPREAAFFIFFLLIALAGVGALALLVHQAWSVFMILGRSGMGSV